MSALRAAGIGLCALAHIATAADFARDIQPIFEKRCQACHGAGQQMSGLRLDRRESTLRLIQAGKSAESRLYRLIAGLDPKLAMPPVGARLSQSEIELIRAWIDAGADWPASASGAVHWSFAAPKRPAVPAVQNRAWVRNGIDAFVLARLEREQLEPSPEASKLTLIRRVSLDLTGLPPTPKEVEEFLADSRPDAYERLVDRLFASPHYGEKWARHWLDLARYADSDGYEKDQTRPWAWRYRQWVIEALNRDLPFDRFTIEQLAGDLLRNPSLDQMIATGFHRNTLTNREGGTDPEQFRDEQVIDRAATTGTVWLGLTAGCAQCHDHKYDPIKQKDFYQIFAFYNTATETLIDAPLPGELGPYLRARPEYDRKKRELFQEYHVPELQAEWEKHLRETAAKPGREADWDFTYGVLRVMVDNGTRLIQKSPAQRTERENDAITRFFINSYHDVLNKQRFEETGFAELRKKLGELDAALPPLTQAPVLVENPNPPKTFIHVRGDWRDPGAEVHPDTPGFLPPMPGGAPHNRLGLAQWLVSRDNPLTARVAVNRFWQELFGRGIVRTSEDFGTQGDRPTHPELLDWLACEFMDRGWSMKAIQKLIVMSAAYRQSSGARPELLSRDPENALIARQGRLRLPAELIRDEALAAAGLLDLRIGGQSVRPPQPPGVSELSYANSVKWPESTGPDRYRRGLYIHFQRTTPYPELVNFDAPGSTLSCSRRQRSNTPLQALNLLNDTVFFEAAQGLAHRLVSESRGGFENRLNLAFELALGRKPAAREAERMARYYDRELTNFRADAKSGEALFPVRVEGVDPAETAAWVDVSRVLLNLDEFITRE